jgi:surface antigen
MSSQGLNYSEDGYYYGYKWQCVEFVKRFYYEKFGHEMPDGAGHAKYFFNPMLAQGEFNEQRGLYQYHNGGDTKPQRDDLLVFTDGAYGHVAIICDVGEDWIEVIQQNSEVSRERYHLEEDDGKYILSGEREPAGWLRL